MEQLYKIPNSKHQITNKSQLPIFHDQNLWPATSLSAVCSGVKGPGSNGSAEVNLDFWFLGFVISLIIDSITPTSLYSYSGII